MTRIGMSVVNNLLSEVDKLQQDITNTLMRLIEIATVNPPGLNYEQFCAYVRDMLDSWGVKTKLIQVPRGYVQKHLPECVDYPRYVLLAEIGQGDKMLHFNGHYDVVPPGTGWTVCEPFKPRYVNGRVYGRGACDMKGGIVAILYTVYLLRRVEEKLNGRVQVALVPDEEVGGVTGTGYIVHELKLRPNYVIVAEPSSPQRVLIGNKGLVWLVVEIYGKQAHGSTPWLGVNAFELGVKYVYAILDELKQMTESRVSKFEYDVEGGNKATITLGGDVKSAGKINIVPGYFAFSIDRRVIPEENVDQVEQELVNYLLEKARQMNIQVSVKVVQKSSPALTSPDSELVKKLEEAAHEVLGIKLRKVVCTGGLDTRYYQEVGIQAVTYGPGNAEVAHMADEFIEVQDIVKVVKVYLKLCEKLLM